MAETVIDTKLIFPNDFTLKENPAYDDVLMIYDASTGTVKQVKMEKVISTSAANIIGAAIATDTPKGTELVGQSYRVGNDTDSAVTFTNFLDKDGNPLVLQPKAGGLFTKNANGWAFVPEVKTALDATLQVSTPGQAAADAVVGKMLNDKINQSTQVPTEFIDSNPTIVSGHVYTSDGTWDNNGSYQRSTTKFYLKGSIIYVTMACLGNVFLSPESTGLAGYATESDQDSFISELDAFGKPIGALWDNDRANLLNGTPYPASSDYNIYVRQRIVIPQDMWIRACSYNGAGPKATPLKIEVGDFTQATNDVLDIAQSNTKKIDGVNGQFNYIENQDITIIGDNQLANALTGGYHTISTIKGIHNAPLQVRQSDKENITIAWGGYVTGNDESVGHLGLMGLDADGNFVSTLDDKGRPIGELFSYARYMDLPVQDRPEATSKTSGTSLTFEKVLLVLPKEVWFVVGSGYTSQTLSGNLVSDCPLTLGIQKATESLAQDVQDLKDAKIDGSSIYMDRLATTVHSYSRRTRAVGTSDPIDNFVALHVSDSHYYGPKAQENMAEMLKFANHPDVSTILDSVICTGDICNGYMGRQKSLAVDEINAFMTDLLKFSNNTNVRIQQIKGNHDPNTSQLYGSVDMSQVITSAELYDLMFRPLVDKYPDIKPVENTAYHYTDYAAYGIRVIGLDCYNLPETADENGISIYKDGVVGSYYGQAQMNWLYNTLKTVPSGYHVLILNHGSMIEGQDFYNYMQGWDVITKMLDAYMKGTAYTHSYTNSYYPELNTSLEVDFTTEGPRPVCGVLSGHTHAPLVTKNPTYPDLNHIVIACGKMDNGSPLYSNGCFRNDTVEGRNSFGILSIDTIHRRIFYTIYGQFRDASGVLREQTSFIEY